MKKLLLFVFVSLVGISLQAQVVANQPDPLVVCNNLFPVDDGFAEFDLTLADDDIIGGQTNIVVSYHETQMNAENDLFQLPNIYENDDPYNDVVFARAESTVTGEYDTVPLYLEVRDRPIITEPAPLELCDDNTDGFQIFDLNQVIPEVLNGLDPLEYDVYFYQAEIEAIWAGDLALTNPDFSNAISNPVAFQNIIPYNQIIFVLVVGNNANTEPNNGAMGCYEIVPLGLLINQLPNPVTPTPLEVCDDDNDGFADFDLTEKDIEIVNGDPILTVTYHETLQDAQMGIFSIPNLYENIVPYFQIVYARVESGSTGCYAIVELELVVDALPIPIQAEPYELCDDIESGSNTDNISIFDLNSRIDEITGSDPLLTVTFFETLADETNDTPILNPEAYPNSGNPTSIIVRVENIAGCRALTSLTLGVIPSPDIDEPIDLYVDEGDGDGFAIFDLTVNEPIILGGLDPADYNVSFYESLMDALANTNAIAVPTNYVNVGNPQTIWVRVENIIAGCYVVTSFEIETDELDPLADEDGDGVINQDEDLNSNGNFEDDDTDGDGIPNYLDTDDDGDSVATVDEITGIGAGIAPSNYIFIDTDGDGIENYLDNDDDGDGTLTIDEDYNNNGNPIDDDTNGNGIPDFLDDEVFLNIASQTFTDLTLYPNPTSEKLTMHSSQLVSETQITIFSIQGQRLFLEKAIPQNGTLEINVSGIAQGVYFVHLTSEGKMVVRKFVKE